MTNARKTKLSAANDTQLSLPNIVATIFFNDIVAADDARGAPYYALKGVEIDMGNGKVVTRTCMAFETYDLVKQVVLSGRDLTVTLQPARSVMKIIGVEVDGEMIIPNSDLAIAV